MFSRSVSLNSLTAHLGSAVSKVCRARQNDAAFRHSTRAPVMPATGYTCLNGARFCLDPILFQDLQRAHRVRRKHKGPELMT